MFKTNHVIKTEIENIMPVTYIYWLKRVAVRTRYSKSLRLFVELWVHYVLVFLGQLNIK